MISPFLFSGKACEATLLYPVSEYAGRSEDGGCLGL